MDGKIVSPGVMVDLFADAMALHRPTVVQVDRILAGAGLRTKGARGVNAPSVRHLDVVRLLLAFMAGDAVKEAADNVRRLGRYLTHPVLIRREELNGGRSCGDRRQIDPAEVISLPDIHCLEDAMAHVLERLSDPSYLEGLDLHSTEKISSNRSYRIQIPSNQGLVTIRLGPFTFIYKSTFDLVKQRIISADDIQIDPITKQDINQDPGEEAGITTSRSISLNSLLKISRIAPSK